MAVEITDLLHPDGTENPSGLSTLHGYALLSDFATIQRPKDLHEADATLANIAAIATAHVFKAGKSMKKVYATQNMNEMSFEPVGEEDSIGQKGTVTLKHPGSKKEADGLARLLNSSNTIWFIQETDGKVRQFGSERFPAKARVAYATGNNEAYRGYTITITAYTAGVLYEPGLNFTPAA
ncbi:MAG: hypothetical protein INR69_15070 [Mucilaginibacter polytrichastri]|nr:hypothetical protein [Mucilaginibacter polytrichastri]